VEVDSVRDCRVVAENGGFHIWSHLLIKKNGTRFLLSF
jgi:hypothetical protein